MCDGSVVDFSLHFYFPIPYSDHFGTLIRKRSVENICGHNGHFNSKWVANEWEANAHEA
jgi:hypothetical protein